MEFEQAIIIIQLAIIVVMFWLANRKFPAQPTQQLIDQLAKTAEKTQTRVDDMAVQVLKILNELRMGQSDKTEK